MTATVAAAFKDDPAWAFLFGEDYGRLARHFAAALFDARVAQQDVWVNDDLMAVAMWDSPRTGDGASAHAERIWAGYRAIAGEETFARLMTYNSAVAAAAPAEQYWYLGVLATHPNRQHAGLATAVLAPILKQADRDGMACCLETSTVGNRRFYERRGFTQPTEIVLPGGPPTWWLRRPPEPRALG